MKLAKLTLCLATLALGVASAASSYSITLPAPVSIGEAKLNAGNYKLEVQENQVIFKRGKSAIPVPVTIEKNASTIRDTRLDTSNATLRAISLAGTNLKLVFAAEKPNSVQ